MEAVSALFQSATYCWWWRISGVCKPLIALRIPVVITHHMIGIYVMGVSIVLSGLLVFIQRRALQQSNSLAVEADSVHYGSDILVNIGTLIVLAASFYGAPLWLDGVFAMGVAGFMVYMARGIAVKSLDMLLDRELSDDDRARIIKVIEAHDGGCRVARFTNPP